MARLLREHLDSHLPAQRELLGQIDLGHGPVAQPPQQSIAAQLPAGQVGVEWHRRSRGWESDIEDSARRAVGSDEQARSHTMGRWAGPRMLVLFSMEANGQFLATNGPLACNAAAGLALSLRVAVESC